MSREFWRGVLLAGAMTSIPRWSTAAAPGVAEHTEPICAELASALARVTAELRVPRDALLLAAHAKVLAALCGAPEVATGCVVAPGTHPLPGRLSTAGDSWREVALAAAALWSDLDAHADSLAEDDLDELRRELGLTEAPFETVLDPTGGPGELAGDTVLRVGISPAGEPLALHLRYRTEVLDAGCAARIAGYHHRALTLIAADPDADHGRAGLLGAEETHRQLHEFPGPVVPLPEQRFHQLFELRAAAHPEAIAAVHGERTWTYGELNARANRLARALLARGLRREGVVAVVTERNLDWMAGVLAIFKAGGVYLPIEPHFPSDRIAATLRRAQCEFALTEPASAASLDGALPSLPGVERLLVDTAYGEEHLDTDPGIEVTEDQLAYIYFTSGSTGEPKGAMCEQAGMLNHLLAKIEDLEIGEGQVVAQTAPQCFDISLWQLISALLVGGRTLLIPQEVVLDVARFVECVDAGRVNVLQVVPSYLEAVLSHLEQRPQNLAHLRVVSVTGEAVKKELTLRWFAAEPGIRLVNAYGLTETSDDTNHEVMDRVPESDRVPLGPAIRNVTVYVVDEHLAPVPLGAPGEIVFSGICVGRGYINDPDRTRAAFLADPHRPGQRLYRSGDHGRWRPDGKLEFLGRRDTQIKISGFRIEIGEIENTLLRVPGVGDGAVVVAGDGEASRHLVAFYAGPAPLDAGLLRDRLGESLPGYMVPVAFHWRAALPLTANGKVDRKALTAAAGELEADAAVYRAPSTPTERRLAGLWAELLGVHTDRIGREDSFLQWGGTSLLAVKLVIALDRAVSLKQLTSQPTLADLAALIDRQISADPPPVPHDADSPAPADGHLTRSSR